jgi:hypothetical protein
MNWLCRTFIEQKLRYKLILASAIIFVWLGASNFAWTILLVSTIAIIVMVAIALIAQVIFDLGRKYDYF